MSEDEKTYEGQCYCGAVKIAVTGDAVGAGYCHCAACRSWSAGPVNAFTLWKPEATIPSYPFAPGVHVNYESTVLPMKDGLPKLKDFPAELGGSGETLAE